MDTNPYEGHPELSQLEAEVLWEYAKFAKQVKQVSGKRVFRPLSCCTTTRIPTTFKNFYQLLTMTRELCEAPDQAMLGKLRELERKFGFVLTLVNGVILRVLLGFNRSFGSSRPPFGQQ